MRRAVLVALSWALLFVPAATAKAPRIDAGAWALLDARNGGVLTAKARDQRRPIASATKIMTALVVLDRLDPDRQVVAQGYESIPVESVAGLERGDSFSVSDLLHALLMASANDAAAELARASARSEAEFVERMNRRADRMGLSNTAFANPIGLDDPNNYSSALDLARMAIELRDRKLTRRIVAKRAVTLRSGLAPIRIENRNTLLGAAPWIDGVKTGQTLGAGSVLVASGKRKGAELVSVVLGAPGEEARDAGSLALLRWGFGQYERRKAVRRGERVGRVPIRDSEGEELGLEAADGLELTLRRSQQPVSVLDVPDEVEGPIEAGERVGAVRVSVDGRIAGSVPVLAARAVEAPALLDRAPPFLAFALIGVGAVVILAGIAGVGIRRPTAHDEE